MTLKRRVEALERAAPADDDGIVIIWHSIVTPPGRPCDERLGQAWITAGPGGDGATLTPAAGETSEAFEARALSEARRIHQRTDEAWLAALRWNPEPTFRPEEALP